MIKVDNKVMCENCFADTCITPCPECGFDGDRNAGDPMMLRLGSILAGRYAVGKVIGKGGFGITYLAYDLKLGCKVAVKEYYPYGLAVRFPDSSRVSVSGEEAGTTFKSGADRFYDEARIMAQFNGNPNIVSVHDFFYENNTVYFTMGYLDGKTLKEYLKEQGALMPEQAVYVADAITNALMAAHSRSVLHRDISPDNIMVCRDGTIKLLDFGAARQVLAEDSQSLSVILKQGFAPLEQYQKKGKQGPWTDIYSLGATLYYALTLDVPEDPMSRLEDDRQYKTNIRKIEEKLRHIIEKATELKGADRYQNISELREALGGSRIEPLPLTAIPGEMGKIQYGTAGRSLGGRACPKQVRKDDEAGATIPLQECGNKAAVPPGKNEGGGLFAFSVQDGIIGCMPFVLMEEITLWMAVHAAQKRKKPAQCRKYRWILRCISIAMYYCFLTVQTEFWFLMPFRYFDPGESHSYAIFVLAQIALSEILFLLYVKESRICAVLACLGGPAISACYLGRLYGWRYLLFLPSGDRFGNIYRRSLLCYVVLSVIALALAFHGKWRLKSPRDVS